MIRVRCGMSRNRVLPKVVLIGVTCLLLPSVVGFGLLFAVLTQRSQDMQFDPRVRHYVSKRMISETEKMATQTAAPFLLKDIKGVPHGLSDLTKDGPVLLYFINQTCPCSVDAEPMFNAFAVAYPQAKVVGVIDCEGPPAQKWADENQSNHTILVDPLNKTMADYKAISSVYSALITQGGKIVKMWPGYSQTMMDEASKALADLVGAPAAKLDRRLAPKEMAAGCEFKLPGN